jgi:transposase InsO family protein
MLGFLAEAKALGVSERSVCDLLTLDRRTIQNWRRKGTRDRRKGSARAVAHRLSAQEEAAVLAVATSMRCADMTPEQIVATLADEGIYVASVSSFYRILRKHKALAYRQESRKPRKAVKPVYRDVTGPNQVWSWDITWLKTTVAGMFLYAYSIIDLYDRSLVGWAIETSESEDHARRLFQRTIRDLGVVPMIVHADNGNPMRGVTLAVFLDSLMITRSYSRPRCSNDNAFIEAWHKTLKYSVGYPRYFASLGHARNWFAEFINWYNTEHQHSGIGYVTPKQRRTGEAQEIYERRNRTLNEARIQNPLRWKTAKTMVYGSLPVKAFYRPSKKTA